MPYIPYVENPPAAFKTQVASQDLYANPQSLISALSGGGGGGTAPSGPPGVASTLNAPTSSEIDIIWSTLTVTGKPTPTQFAQYSERPNEGFMTLATISPINPGYLEANASGLAANTPYYFQTVASNTSGIVSSATSVFSTISSGPTPVAPSAAPTVPAFVPGSATQTSVSVTFDVAGITGTPTPTYGLVYGTTTSPNSNLAATLSSGTIYQGTATGLTAGTNYYFESLAGNNVGVSTSVVSPAFSTLAGSGVGPNVAPSIPLYDPFSAGANGFSCSYNISSVTGTPTPSTFLLINSSNYPSTFIPASNVGPFEPFILTGLSTGVYNVQSVASNASGVSTSVATQMSTLLELPPSGNITNLTFLSSSASTISFSYDATAVVPSGNGILYEYLIGTTSPPTEQRVAANGSAFGRVISTTATSLSSGTSYYVQPLITNDYGAISSTQIGLFSTLGVPPPPITAVSTILGIPFFLQEGGADFILDTSSVPDVGNWNATTGIISGNTSGVPAPTYLAGLQAAGNKLVLSLGGGTANEAVLSSMFQVGGAGDAGAAALANSVVYSFFNGATNPLGFSRTQWTGFAFDGVDLDIEANTPSTTSLYVFASTLRADPAFANKIITTAPQTPYLTGVGSSGITANGTFQSFTNIVPPSQLNATYVGGSGNQYSLLAPLGGQLVDYNFLQVYNNASYAYPTGAAAGNWNNALAGWGLSLIHI